MTHRAKFFLLSFSFVFLVSALIANEVASNYDAYSNYKSLNEIDREYLPAVFDASFPPTITPILPTNTPKPTPSNTGEPNNDPCNAFPINTNEVNYFFPEDEHDWYVFNLYKPARLKIKLEPVDEIYWTWHRRWSVYTGNCLSLSLL
jgi:hypothetical protein